MWCFTEGSALLSLHCGCSCNRGKTHIILQNIEDLPLFLGPAGYQVCLGLCFTFGLKHPMASCQERILSALTFITASVLHPSSFIILYIPGGMARVSHGRRKSWAAGASSSWYKRREARGHGRASAGGTSILCPQEEHTPHCLSRHPTNGLFLPKAATAFVFPPSNSSHFPGITNTSMHPSKPRPRGPGGSPRLHSDSQMPLCPCRQCLAHLFLWMWCKPGVKIA